MDNGRIKILYAGTSYPADDNDWRGRFSANVVEALSRSNKLELSTCLPPGKLPENVKSRLNRKEAEWMSVLMRRGGIAHLIRSKGVCSVASIFKLLFYFRRAYKRIPMADVVHINWLQNALPLYGTSVPAVISVLGSDFALMRFPGMKLALRKVIAQRKCVIAPNGEWMVPILEEIFGDIAMVHAVPFGVDGFWFDMSRINVESNCYKWIVVSRVTKDKIGTLFDWGKDVFIGPHELHLIGPIQEEGVKIPEWIHYHGPVSPEALRRTWFPQASGLITLSRHSEGRPQVMIEAMAAGLPVIASDISAHMDFVQSKKTGYIISSFDEFKDALTLLSNPEHNEEIGSAAREFVTNKLGTWDDCAERYIALYHEVLRGS